MPILCERIPWKEGNRSEERTHTYWQHESYRLHPADVEPSIEPTIPTADTWDQQVGDVDHPDGESPVTPNKNGYIEIRGVAWAGDDRVTRFEISSDGGDSWHDTDLYRPDYNGAWRLFAYSWEPNFDDGTDDTYTLLSRATDERDRTQPARIVVLDEWGDIPDTVPPWNEGGYAVNADRPGSRCESHHERVTHPSR